MSRLHTLVSVSCFLIVAIALAPASLAAPAVSSVPSSIDRSDATAIEVSVSGLTGSELQLRMLVDLNGNGAADPGDEPIWSGAFIDNGSVWSPTMPADTDPATGTVTLDLRLVHPLGFPYSVGSFLWQAEDPANGSTSVTAFVVTQGPEPQTVTGRVTVGGTPDPVAGALVLLLPFSEECEDPLLSAFTDPLGDYVIQVPDDIPCSNRLVLSLKPGFVTGLIDASPLEFTGGDMFTGVDLTLEPAMEIATGSLLYESGPRIGEGIAGVFIFGESDDDGISVTFTDLDGSYALGVTDGNWQVEADNDDQLALQGAVGREDTFANFSVAGGPAMIPDLLLPAANAFIRGTLFDDFGSPLAGRRVEADRSYPCFPDCLFAGTITDPGGAFVLGVEAPAGPDTVDYVVGPLLPLEGLVGTRSVATLSANDDLPGQDLAHLAPTQMISGTFSDAEGAPVGDLCIWAETFGPQMYVSRAKVNCDGSYALPVLDGDWNVRFFEDDLLGFFRGLDGTGFQEQVAIAGKDELLDVILGRASFLPTLVRIDPPAAKAGDHVLIEGTNFGTNPPPLVLFGGVPGTVLGTRSDFGRLLVEVPAGVPPGPTTVSFVNLEFGGVPSNEGCFEMLAGSFAPTCSITGTLTINAGAAFYKDGLVVALDRATGDLKRIAVSDASGAYSLELEDPSATYDLFVISSANTLRVWGFYEGVSCPAVQDHNLRTGRFVSGRVTGQNGESLAGVRVEAEGSLSFADSVTDELGEYAMRMENGDTVGFRFTAPGGSRYVNDRNVQLVVNGPTLVPDVQLSTGSLFGGRVLDRDGNPALVSIFAAPFGGGGGSSGHALPDTCTGAFTIALPTGRHDLRLQDNRQQEETRVEWLDIDGDERSEFDFTMFDGTVVPFTGPEPRLNDDLDPLGQVGQPVTFGVENLADVGVTALFAPSGAAAQGGFGIVGDDTVWDPVRGLLLTRVPAGAGSGDFVIDVQGSASRPYPFTLLPGSWNPGSFTLSGTVSHAGAPVEGAMVILFRSDPNEPFCDDDLPIHDYFATDASGAFTLNHPGGNLLVSVLPPRTATPVKGVGAPTDLAPLVMEFLGETGNRPGVVVDLVTGVPLTLRAVIAPPPPLKAGAGVLVTPVPNAQVFADGDAFDFGLTGADGTITMWLPPGPLTIEVIGPVGSRLVATEGEAPAPSDLGDVVLAPGIFVGGRFTDPQEDPIFGAFAEVFSTSGGNGFFSEATTRDNGVWNVPVPDSAPFGGSVGTDSDALSDIRFNYDSGLFGDLIRYPSDMASLAGIIEGTIVDSIGMAPLPFTFVSAMFDEFGFPGATSGGELTCDDGSYRVKVAEGSHFVAAFPDYYFSDLLQGWYSPGTPADFCFDDAEPVFVAAGATVSGVDIALDTRSGISGAATVFGNPEAGLNINITQGRLGSCRVDAFTDGYGGYNAEVPAGAGYRAEAQSPPSIGGPSQCWDGESGCAAFTPITTVPLETTFGINFAFGFAPGEVSQFAPLLTVRDEGGGMVTLTFEKRPPEDRADRYNFYGGTLGTFGTALEAACFLDPVSFIDNGDGTFSHTFIPNPGDEWFLVSATNPFDEGPLGNGRVLSNTCGPLP